MFFLSMKRGENNVLIIILLPVFTVSIYESSSDFTKQTRIGISMLIHKICIFNNIKFLYINKCMCIHEYTNSIIMKNEEIY